MAEEERSAPEAPKPPKDVGHVDAEVVGVDDVSRGKNPDRPPTSDYARVVGAACWVFVPFSVYVLGAPELASDTFARASAVQAIGLWAAIIVVFFIPCLGTILSILGVVLAAHSAVRTWRGEYVRIPVIWQIARRWM